MSRRLVIASLTAVAFATSPAVAFALAPVTMKEAQSVASKIRQKEAADDYQLSDVVDGGFDIENEGCFRTDRFHITCSYHVEGRSFDATGRNIRCGVEVRVTKKRGARHATGVRKIIGCARG